MVHINAYKLLEFWILIEACLAYIIPIHPNNTLKDKSKKVGFILSTLIPLIILTGFRGNMRTDYLNYQYIYEYRISSKSFIELLFSKEPGFAILQKIVGICSNYNIICLMTVLAIITCIVYYYFFFKYSDMLWLSVFMLLVIGSYYTSFNTTRQYLAAALFTLCVPYIINRKLWKYIFLVLLISTVHISVILMLPFYFLLNFNWKYKKNGIVAVCIIASLIFICNFIDLIVNLMIKGYTERWEPNSPLQLVRVLFVLFMIFINKDIIDMKKPLDRICINSVIYLLAFYLMSLKVYMAYRFTYYMLPFSLVFLPNIISRRKNGNTKFIMEIILGIFLLSYILIVQGDLKFEWFWQ